ncbi:hypothetical protein BR63_09335 [Thermanaerosceptrum fracticalcis]|uniref:Uncharacterized protein n=1 Tax=Thermanaerosceptrum fracticalcis TaxID=1712410 RepID=A0A7G6E341_THEFR|nr:hypothetical protein [Thermanaerosceptrum fracticalcis]QNB46495.1 hypothetical protein BR63_09335 [Thermanaerosceptrum fracticalcis]
MTGYHEKSSFHHISEERQTQTNLPQDSKEVNEDNEDKEKKNPNEITLFGVKMSYAKTFGIAFMVLFALLFFPGIGVSSSQVKKEEIPQPSEGQENINQ